jgi:hypothetical protein
MINNFTLFIEAFKAFVLKNFRAHTKMLVAPSDLVDFPNFVCNIAIPRFVYGIQRKFQVMKRSIETGNKATKDPKIVA